MIYGIKRILSHYYTIKMMSALLYGFVDASGSVFGAKEKSGQDRNLEQ